MADLEQLKGVSTVYCTCIYLECVEHVESTCNLSSKPERMTKTWALLKLVPGAYNKPCRVDSKYYVHVQYKLY